jgi:hypothetical protein
MVRRLAIALFVLSSLAMGVLGWMLGRPGVFRPDRHVAAAEPSRSAGSDASIDASSTGAGAHAAFDSAHASSGD